MKRIVIGIISFFLLDLYFFTTTHFISNAILQFIGLLSFFPIASIIARLNGLSGLQGIGLQRTNGWKTHFFVSFLIGIGIWGAMYVTYGLLGKYEVIGLKSGIYPLLTILLVMIGYFFGSLINDLITRGFIINMLKGKLPLFCIGIISILVYALDDLFIGGFTLTNLLFSIILGCSLTYSFIKTDAVWADTGIHYGLNIAYGLLYGLGGNDSNGIFLINEKEINPFLNNGVLLGFASLMFLIVYFYYRRITRKM